MNENLLERRDSYSLHSLTTHSFRASDFFQLAFSFFPQLNPSQCLVHQTIT